MNKESRRLWSLYGVLIIIGSLVVFAIRGYLDKQVPEVWEREFLLSNLGFFLLINLNIIVLMVLVFIVGKNLVKLVLDRRRKILGSRLRSRLVTAFVGLSLIPTVLLFFVAKGILGTVLQGWFSPQVAASVDGALDVAKYHYDSIQAQVFKETEHMSKLLSGAFADVLASGVNNKGKLSENGVSALNGYLDEKRNEYGLSQLAIVTADGVVIAESRADSLARESVGIPPPNLVALARALRGERMVRPEQSLDSEFLRGYAPIFADSTANGPELTITPETGALGEAREVDASYGLLATLWISPELNEVLSRVIDAYDDYKELKSYRRPLASSYTLTLVIVTLLVIFAAVWVGFYLAKSLTVPIQHLAQATEEVAHGNLDVKIPDVADDELGILVRSFNKMTADLKASADELLSRRRYMETVLASVGVGVISVDRDGKVTTFNLAAREMLKISTEDVFYGSFLERIVPVTLAEKLKELLGELYINPDKVDTTNTSLYLGGETKHVQITATKLVDTRGVILGAVILLDDLTELVAAQRMAAWRDVARRIAHEIKNPLTPIQLSAQRMQRRFVNARGDAAEVTKGSVDSKVDSSELKIISECTETIIKQVETLRNLVNEFSRFARMPKTEPRPTNLNQLIQETGAIYREAHPGINFEINCDQSMPVVEIDREQIGRALVNLIDNAVSSVTARAEAQVDEDKEAVKLPNTNATPATGFTSSIVIKSGFDKGLGIVAIEVADSGLGIPDEDKTKVFEPYFSKKRGGTGLGLAIVNSIITDHRGFIRVRDNSLGGATFIIELPLSQELSQALSKDERMRIGLKGA